MNLPATAVQSMPERASALRRMRRVATSLLVAMALVLVLARMWQASYPGLSYLVAFAEAALVGGIADWFAVTALFRHPFGLPLPHTAIIPNNKERIGENIGTFLQHNFMTREVLQEELSHIDFAAVATAWLAERSNRQAMAGYMVRAVPPVVNMLDEEEMLAALRNAVATGVTDVRFGPLLAQVLDVLVSQRQHHLLLQRLLGIVARAFEQYSPHIRQKIGESSPRWLPRAIDEQFFRRLVEGVQAFLIEVQADDAWRVRFETATHDMIRQLATDPAYEERLRGIVEQAIDHPLALAWYRELWQAARKHLLVQAGTEGSPMTERIELVLEGIANALDKEATARSRLNEWIRNVVTETIVKQRDVITAVIWRVIHKWDAATISSKVELQVGQDLQYIRINGTVVGGLVGLALHLISRIV